MCLLMLLPMKYVLVDQETGVMMQLGEQLPLMMMTAIGGRRVVVLANQRIDDRDPYPR